MMMMKILKMKKACVRRKNLTAKQANAGVKGKESEGLAERDLHSIRKTSWHRCPVLKGITSYRRDRVLRCLTSSDQTA